MTHEHATPALKVTDAHFRYGDVRALDGLSVLVPSGISFGLLGPNGAGKTTLIRAVAGLLRLRRGRLRVLGEAPSRRTSERIGYMPQLHSLYMELSVQQNVEFFARIYGLNDRADRTRAVQEAVQLVGLWPRRGDSVAKLSGGMKQRVSLACAIVHNPPLLLLDEPTVGLDPELRAAFWEHFRELNGLGVTIIISSHTMDDAAHCDCLAFIREGRVIASGTPDELRAGTGQPSLEGAFLAYVRSKNGHAA
jgi:ABC-2 type transport system ATP-binding protein